MSQELALFRLDQESSFLEFLKDFADLLLMLLESARIDQDVVDITNAEDVKVFAESIIHESLGRSGSIGEPKGHNEEFKQSITSPEGGFPFVTFLNSDLVKASLEIESGKVFATMDLVQSFFDSR